MMRDLWAAIGGLWRVWIAAIAIIFVGYVVVQVLTLAQWVNSLLTT